MMSFVLAGIDVKKAVAHFRKLPVFREFRPPRVLEIDVGHCREGGCGGRAWATRIRVYGGPETEPRDVVEVTLHELCHVALPRQVRHGELFRRVFSRACREAWGIHVPVDPPVPPSGRLRAYVQSDLLLEALGDVAFPEYAPDPEPSLEERKAARVAQREEHARAMLKKAETRLKRAKTLRARWKRKVDYYEREAAARKRL